MHRCGIGCEVRFCGDIDILLPLPRQRSKGIADECLRVIFTIAWSRIEIIDAEIDGSVDSLNGQLFIFGIEAHAPETQHGYLFACFSEFFIAHRSSFL
jgi:hypothetical protein